MTVDARTYVVDVEVAHKANVTARTHVGNVDVELPQGRYDVETDTAVGDADVEGVVDADQARHTIEARADVGTVDGTAR